MDEEKIRLREIIPPVVISILVVGLVIWYLSDEVGCDDCFELEGNLSAIKKSGHIVVDGQDYFISDWFSPNRNMPYYVNDYIGHRVHIDYVAGCGRRMITDIKIIN